MIRLLIFEMRESENELDLLSVLLEIFRCAFQVTEADFCSPANQPGFPLQVRLNPLRKPRDYIKSSRWMEYFNIPFLIVGWITNGTRCTAEYTHLRASSCTVFFICRFISNLFCYMQHLKKEKLFNECSRWRLELIQMYWNTYCSMLSWHECVSVWQMQRLNTVTYADFSLKSSRWQLLLWILTKLWLRSLCESIYRSSESPIWYAGRHVVNQLKHLTMICSL